MFNSSRLNIGRDSEIIKDINPDYVRTEYSWHKDRIKMDEELKDTLEEGFKAHFITGVE